MTKKYSVNISDRLLAEIIKMQKDKQADKSQSCNDNSKETQFDKFTPSTMKHIIEHYLTYCPHDFMPRFFFDKKGDTIFSDLALNNKYINHFQKKQKKASGIGTDFIDINYFLTRVFPLIRSLSLFQTICWKLFCMYAHLRAKIISCSQAKQKL